MPDQPPEAPAPDALAVCAQGECDLQRVLHQGLGSRWLVEDGLGWAPDGVPHHYLLGAVTLDPSVDPARLADVRGTVCDSFDALPGLPGRTPEPENEFMVRWPAPMPDPPPVQGLAITVVTSDAEVGLWERTTFCANGAPPSRTGELHPAGSQHQNGLTLLLARLDGEPAGTAMVVVGERCLTPSAVAVMPDARRRGIGAALVVAALAVAPDLPATLGSSEDGAGVYRSLGFEDVGRPVHWAAAIPD